MYTQEEGTGNMAGQVVEVQQEKRFCVWFLQEEKKKKPKKLPTELIIEEEPEQILAENLPEGGPRLEEQPIQLQEEEMEFVPKTIRTRTTKKVEKGIKELGPEVMIQIGDTPLPKRIPPPSIYDMKVSSYYMNNREIFVLMQFVEFYHCIKMMFSEIPRIIVSQFLILENLYMFHISILPRKTLYKK